ncbi:hypothetical protein Tco_0858493 [Tanacetum coccineum]|uniref:Uncharacterized protein n=1 Tax=Tanacetum coccineum TaxID=301880 RepID=A0ABQ5B996_9ASTR
MWQRGWRRGDDGDNKVLWWAAAEVGGRNGWPAVAAGGGGGAWRRVDMGIGVTELTARPRSRRTRKDIYAMIRVPHETARLLGFRMLWFREAPWGRSIEVSYMTRSEIKALRSVVMGQQAVISQLQAADRKSQVVTLEMLQVDYQRQVQLTKALELLKGLQTQMAEFQRQVGPAKSQAQPDAPGEAGSSS